MSEVFLSRCFGSLNTETSFSLNLNIPVFVWSADWSYVSDRLVRRGMSLGSLPHRCL
jgi:hypothetical protein